MKSGCEILNIKDESDKYKCYWECAPDLLFVVDLDGGILDVNSAVISEYGYSFDELVSMNLWDIRTPGERGFMKEQLYELFEHANVIRTVHQRRDGSAFPVEINSRGAVMDGKNVLLCVVRDIAEREEVEKLKSQCYAIVESTDDAIIGTSSEGVINEWNTGAEKLYGYTGKEAIGHTITMLVDPEHKSEIKNIIETIRNGGHVVHYNTVRVKKSGERIHISSTASPIVIDDRIRGISWVARDITERLKAEEELKEARNSAEMYLDLMGHDINNMNQIALGYLELAKSAQTLSETKRMIEKPIESINNSSRLIENVRKLQRIKEKNLKYHVTDLCGILDEIKRDYESTAGRTIIIHYKPIQGCLIIANELIKDVFSNLVVNAIKHSDQNKPLKIDINLSAVKIDGNDYYKVEVADNGPGVPDNSKSMIFGRFERGRTKAKGRGLGLYLVNTLVNDFHGKIRVEDRVPGNYTKGAKFVVILPSLE